MLALLSRFHTAPLRAQTARVLIVIALLLLALAMVQFPLDPEGSGYRFSYDYFCDLLDPETRFHAPNPGRLWAVLGLSSLALSIHLTFWAERGLLRILGTITTACLVGMAIGTAIGKLWIHTSLVLVGGPIGLTAMTLLFLRQRETQRLAFLLGALTLLFGGWNLVQYARQVSGAPRWALLPLVQKFVALSGFAWLYVSAPGTQKESGNG